MKFERNILSIDETDSILDEQFTCPNCGSKTYSSLAIESKDVNFIQDKDSKKTLPMFLLLAKCDCQNMWIENLAKTHHRSHIRSHWMINFK